MPIKNLFKPTTKPTFEKFSTPQTAWELQQHQCLLYESQTLWQFNENGHQIKLKPQSQVYSNNGYALVQMARAGQLMQEQKIHL
ncbi:hypothetical protein [Glaesserella parasuis]|uniref:hypothetical protein n=1 Tax=Glaesserella parasuis TaxID=738 RepID=UPI00192068E4|nr:hypothetical protein [Glaesserella parasuis]